MKTLGKTILAGITGGIMVAFAMTISNSFDSNKNTTSSEIKKILDQEIVSEPTQTVGLRTSSSPELAMDFTYAAEVTLNAVVHVTNEFTQEFRRDPFYEFFYQPKNIIFYYFYHKLAQYLFYLPHPKIVQIKL